MNQAISSIKDTIKQQTAASREIRKEIHAAKGMDRWYLWQEKRDHGHGSRYTLLAYACLRGRAYWTVEAKYAEGNEPSATGILSRIQSALPQDCPERAEWTLERVKGWLKEVEAPAVSVEAA